MPDISMCANTGCPLSTSCYRHKASGTRACELRQAYADFKFIVSAVGTDRDGAPINVATCDYYWPVESQA